MGKDKLEHSIKSKLSTYESSVNTDKLWAGIQAGMGASAAGATEVSTSAGATSALKGKMIIGLSIAAVALITVGSLWYFNGTDSSDILKNNEINTEEITAPALANSSDLQEAVNLETTSPIDINSTVEKTVSTLNQTTSPNQKTISIDKTSTFSNTPATTKTITYNTTSQNTTTSFPQSNATTLGLNQNQQNGTKISERSINSDESVVVQMENTTINSSKENITFSNNSSIMSDAMKVEKSEISYSMLEGSSLMGLNGIPVDFSFDLQLPKNTIECPSFGGSSNSGGVFMGEIQAIPYYSIPRITATSDAGEIWKQNKLDTESYLETFQVNLVGRYQMNNGLYFNAGIGYGQLDEKFEFAFEETFVTQEEIPVTIIIRPDGNNDTIPGQGEVTQDSTSIASTYNYHRMVEFTVGLGYEFAVNQRISIYGDVGMSINIFTSRTGFHLLDDIDVVDFNNSSRPVFNTSTGYKLTGGVGLRYYAGNGVVLSAGPEFRSHMSNWIRDEHPIELRYLDIGMRMGVGYMF